MLRLMGLKLHALKMKVGKNRSAFLLSQSILRIKWSVCSSDPTMNRCRAKETNPFFS